MCVGRSVPHVLCLRYAAHVRAHFCFFALSCTCSSPFRVCKPLPTQRRNPVLQDTIPDATFNRPPFLKFHEFIRAIRGRGGKARKGNEGGVPQPTSPTLVFWTLALTMPNPLAFFIPRPLHSCSCLPEIARSNVFSDRRASGVPGLLAVFSILRDSTRFSQAVAFLRSLMVERAGMDYSVRAEAKSQCEKSHRPICASRRMLLSEQLERKDKEMIWILSRACTCLKVLAGMSFFFL